MDKSKKADMPFIIGIIFLVILGTACGIASARVNGKNLLSQHCNFEITLKEDVTVVDLDSMIITAIDSSGDFDSNELNVLLPAGTTGHCRYDVWYYNFDAKTTSYFTVKACFTVADGKQVSAYVTNDPEKLGEEYFIDSNKIESPESVIAEYDKCVESYLKMWRTHQIMGALIGFIISGIVAAVFLLLHKKGIEKSPPSILLIILITLDIILLLYTVFLLYYFTRLL